ncbi:hypothetical protein NDU88_004598 [Pleurodeles waltl]|uniref:Uncharacterized protein n=1 Tax=Pleurodeles waltl TaxID=8319 RepID=A0AAV7LLV7_PLEWA|nr:hypothetical protein NDU88_004598 [Pleurodeles waltl]
MPEASSPSIAPRSETRGGAHRMFLRGTGRSFEITLPSPITSGEYQSQPALVSEGGGPLGPAGRPAPRAHRRAFFLPQHETHFTAITWRHYQSQPDLVPEGDHALG